MAERKRNCRIVEAGMRFSLLVLLTIVSLTVSVSVFIEPIEGNPGGPGPQKGSNVLKQPKADKPSLRAVRPPIDLIAPSKTETATFAMG